jgi:ribonuclease R
MSKISAQDLLEYISESPVPVTKTDIAKAFHLEGHERTELKKLLRTMIDDGLITRKSGRYKISGDLPQVCIVNVTDVSIDGDVFATPEDWNEQQKENLPPIEVLPHKSHAPALGDRLLVRLSKKENLYTAKVIKKLNTQSNQLIGVIDKIGKNIFIRPADKKAKYDYMLEVPPEMNVEQGDIAVAEIKAHKGLSTKKARLKKVIGHDKDPKAITLITISEAGLRHEFSDAVINETKGMKIPELGNRTDIRSLPLVTIDGSDARDFDDAVWAEKTENGHKIIVAIADVSYYVRPGSQLDQEAYLRGNSTYFPDQVVPMLPEALSNDLCSLRPNEDRACVFVTMTIDNQGALIGYKFERGLMKSIARLTYEQVQNGYDGKPDQNIAPLIKDVISPLYDAYTVLRKAREKRGALELDLPEKKIVFNSKNEMVGVTQTKRLDSHKLIEEFMILANIAAASALEDKNAPCAYRVHEKPDALKLESAAEFVQTFGISMPKVGITSPKELNKVLKQASEHEYSHLISEIILRAQTQAYYSPENKNHFGLGLDKYAHFTSPIRRYSDLLVHRSLVNAFNLGVGGLDKLQQSRFTEMTEHISRTERTSADAERRATDRFVASYLSDHVGEEFEGRIRGVTRFGLFVKLDETGADGLVPISTLPDDYYNHVESKHALIGERTGTVYRLGARLKVNIGEVDPLTGSSIFTISGKGSAELQGYELKQADINAARGNSGNRGQKNRNRKNSRRKGRGNRFRP